MGRDVAPSAKSRGNHSGATPLKRIISPSLTRHQLTIAPQLVNGAHSFSSISAGILAALILHSYGVCSHSFYGFNGVVMSRNPFHCRHS